MGISALPQTTVRALGATQVLTDPSALVKELVDNSLDANATSIAIEIHSNTIDIIQVRDNGHGVAPEDRAMVARRYCTSKLIHDQDINSIGGSSLGFRGEALASAAELSGSLIISTRIEGDQVAAALKINQQGEVIGQDRASLPVGTTVRITDFIKANPVRRQVVLKNSETSLKKIKRNLQAYAFARPHVRLSLRVLKSKNNKGDWVYAPKSNGNAEDAAFKIVGSACASQCVWSVVEDNGFTLQAFLPKPDADVSKISNVGSFLSVDARPVSTTRGTFKQVLKLFREALKKTSPIFQDVTEPFLFLEINCLKGSYDPNIEPAKDDVLFEDSDIIMEVTKKLFAAVYPRHEPTINGPDSVNVDCAENIPPACHDRFATSRQPVSILASTPNDYERIPRTQSAMERHVEREPSCETSSPNAHQKGYRSNMYGCDEDDLTFMNDRPSSNNTQNDLEELRQARKDVNLSNPWVLAKMNSSARCSQARTLLPSQPQISQPTNIVSSPSKRTERNGADDAPLLTPRPSSSSQPMRNFQPVNRVTNPQLSRNSHAIGASSLPVPQPYTPQPSSDAYDVDDTPNGLIAHDSRPQYKYGLTPDATEPNLWTPLTNVPDSSRPRESRKQPQKSKVNKPFVPPFKSQAQREKVWFDHLEDIERPRQRHRNRPPNQYSGGLVVQGELGDLVDDPRPLTPPRRNRDIRDFVGRENQDPVAALIESRNHGRPALGHNENENEIGESDAPRSKQIGALGGRGFISARELSALELQISSPEKQPSRLTKRRKTSERRALQEISANAAIHKDATEDEKYRPETGTGRARSHRQSSTKLGRTKLSKLPLERIPAGQGVQNVVRRSSVSVRGISHLTGTIDEAASLLGYNEPAFEPCGVFSTAPLPDLQEFTNNLHDLLIGLGSDTDTPGPDSLYKKLQTAFAQHAENIDSEDTMLPV